MIGKCLFILWGGCGPPLVAVRVYDLVINICYKPQNVPVSLVCAYITQISMILHSFLQLPLYHFVKKKKKYL